MKLNRQHCWSQAFCTLVLLAFAFAVTARAATDYLLWDKDRQRVDANIQTWDVTRLLQRVAASTKWRIYLEPDTKQTVTSRFRNLTEGEALRRLLGNLNFMLVPETNGPACLYVFHNSRDDATQLIRAAEASASKAKPIEDELIVALKPGEKIEDLAKRYGAKVTGQIDSLNAYRLKFADADSASQAREGLLNDASVAKVDYNYSISQPEATAGVNLPGPSINLQAKAPADGKYMIVGLIDSAVQPAQAGSVSSFLLDPLSVVGDAKAAGDQPTHGTSMAEAIFNAMSTVLGKDAATTVRIQSVDVYGNSATSSSFDVAAGITKAIQAGAKVINLSMGSDGDSWIMHEAIKNAASQGIPIFAAAGNEPVTTAVYPAAYPETIAVTARDRDGNISSYANRGDFVKASGPSATLITFGNQTYVVAGTSTATAWLSGLTIAAAEANRISAAKAAAAVQSINPVKRP